MAQETAKKQSLQAVGLQGDFECLARVLELLQTVLNNNDSILAAIDLLLHDHECVPADTISA